MRTFILVCTVFIFGLLIAACSDDSTGSNDDGGFLGNGQPGSMSASLNGTGWTSASAAADTGRIGSTVIAVGIAGVSTTLQGITLGIGSAGGITERAYSFPPTGTDIFVIGFSDGNNPTGGATLDPARSTASIEITSLDFTNNTVSGTFSGDLYDIQDSTLIEVRNGVFNQVILITSPAKPAELEDLMSEIKQ